MKPIPAQRKPLRGDSQKENLDKHTIHRYNIHVFGPVAQLGERSVRIREVESSSLFRSTIKLNQKRYQREKPRSFNDFRAFLRPIFEVGKKDIKKGFGKINGLEPLPKAF